MSGPTGRSAGAALAPVEDGKLAENVLWFARALRKAGLPVGPDRVVAALRAIEAAGFTSRADFYWTLHASFVSRPEHREVFAQVFRLFWRDPRFLEHMMAMLLPTVRDVQEERAPRPAERRAAEALLGDRDAPVPPEIAPRATEEVEIAFDASETASDEERLKGLDFELMSTEELAEARRMLARMRLPVPPLLARRRRPSPHGSRVDARATLRAALRDAGEMRRLHLTRPRTRWPNLVVLCDISGSMSRYSRMLLHFLHAVANAEGQGWARVHAFTFGTRLTNITRHLGQRDVDAALAAAGAEAQDWEGGTRIGVCIDRFNRDWSRRVLAQGAVVLLITDGLDRGDPHQLAEAMERLRLSSRRLIWLNPLLRYDAFAPKARGVATILAHVDELRACHNLASLEALGRALTDTSARSERERLLAGAGGA